MPSYRGRTRLDSLTFNASPIIAAFCLAVAIAVAIFVSTLVPFLAQ